MKEPVDMFSQKFNLSIRDINYANHMDHLALLNYLHEVRVRFLRSQGYSELDVDGQGSGLVVASLSCNYRKECFYGEEIEVRLELQQQSKTRLAIVYTVVKEGNVIVANAEIRVAFLSKARKIITIPEYLQQQAVWVGE